jgi:hypothetical protein
LKPLSIDHEVTAKHRRAMVPVVLVGRDNNAVASGFRRSDNHPLLLAVEHRHFGDGRGVVKSGYTSMREEFTSLAFLAVTVAGVALLGSGLLALVLVG